MARRSVEDMLNDPESIPVEHTCNFGDRYLKFRGLLLAQLQGTDFNTVVKMALDWYVQDAQRKRPKDFEALLKRFPYRSSGVKK